MQTVAEDGAVVAAKGADVGEDAAASGAGTAAAAAVVAGLAQMNVEDVDSRLEKDDKAARMVRCRYSSARLENVHSIPLLNRETTEDRTRHLGLNKPGHPIDCVDVSWVAAAESSAHERAEDPLAFAHPDIADAVAVV